MTSLNALTSLSHQVAGHAGGIKTLDAGQWVVKDCLERELRFYAELQAATHQRELVQRLAKLVPECRGDWHQFSGEKPIDPASTNQIVLENLTHGYSQPNVCDIKLGTQLWDQDATEEKRQRMDLVSQSTTSGTFGIRLTGWQVYDHDTNRFHTIPKTFGKTIQGEEQLRLGVRMLLACPQPQDAAQVELILPGTSVDGPSGSYLPHLPTERIVDLLQHHILPSVQQLVDIFIHLEVRMRGASLLLVYEGSLNDTPTATVRLIDFGHSRLVPGQGIDEGVLLGLRTVYSLLERQCAQLTQ